MDTNDLRMLPRTAGAVSELMVGEEPSAAPKPAKPERLLSLDAYRGLIMLILAGGGFGIAKVAANLRQARGAAGPIWERLAFHVEHPQWLSQFHTIGCSFWDLIQPSFMFMVGVAMVYSYANRKARGESAAKSRAHAVIRAVVLVLLGIFLQSQNKPQINFIFPNVLAQIGLAYLFVYALLGRRFWVQLAALAVILVGYWGLFVFYPAPASPAKDASARAAPKVASRTTQSKAEPPLMDIRVSAEDMARAGNRTDWIQPRFFDRFSMLSNPAMRFDGWFLPLLPHAEQYQPNKGGYTTLNFVPSIATILLGVLAGQLLRGPRRAMAKFSILAGSAVLCMALGAAAGLTICPVIKRIWTPSWVLYSASYTLAILAAFYLVVDILRMRFLGWPLAVVGMNSMAVYLISQMMKPWIGKNLKTAFATFGQDVFSGVYGPMVESLSIVAVIWLLCWWAYRQKLFVRI